MYTYSVYSTHIINCNKYFPLWCTLLLYTILFKWYVNFYDYPPSLHLHGVGKMIQRDTSNIWDLPIDSGNRFGVSPTDSGI